MCLRMQLALSMHLPADMHVLRKSQQVCLACGPIAKAVFGALLFDVALMHMLQAMMRFGHRGMYVSRQACSQGGLWAISLHEHALSC